eukprot:TRINITY_DN10690_c0_g2_i3.p1 TRINITY_DN10690_c0_g2~~TRINITY_DN10690_c0_g2_i3.p1  ORF type:complete len:175 (-),score=29.85 TRINITY_DN10690_c0_g2_i3:100-624(-)
MIRESGVEAKLKLAEQVNKLLFFKNKQLEEENARLQKLAQNNMSEEKQELNIQITQNEKLLLLEIEGQNKKIEELQNTLNKKFEANSEASSYVSFLQKRINELFEDSKRYFDKYKIARSDYLKLLHSKAKDSSNLHALIIRHIKTCPAEESADKKIYCKRIKEITHELDEKLKA